MIREIKLGLNDQAPVSTYGDLTKVFVKGKMAQKSLNGKTVLGSPLSPFIDVFTQSTLAPAGSFFVSPNGRIFSLTAEAGGIVSIMLHTFNFDTGESAYVGRMQVTLPDAPAQTHTYRYLKALDAGTTNWKIIIGTTGTTAQFNAPYIVNKVGLADFVPVGPSTIPFANGNDQKAVYSSFDPAAAGVLNAITSPVGAVMDPTNSRLYVHNGLAANHQYHVFDLAVAPQYSSDSVSVDSTTDVVTHTGHSYSNGDPLAWVSLTGGAPFVLGGVYFVVNAVAGVSYQLSLTVGGAAINVTTNGTGVIGRANGGSTSNFLFKTGSLPALSGTLLAVDSENYCTPQHTANAGAPCTFLATASNLYLGRVSELTAGATSWPSLVTSNIFGAPNEITAPTATLALFSDLLDAVIYTTNVSKFIVKKIQNNAIEAITGELNNTYYEGFNFPSANLGLVTVGAIDVRQGWVFAMGTTVGQRGLIAVRFASDAPYSQDSFITPVYTIDKAGLVGFRFLEELYDYTGEALVEYRTSGFNSESGGWAELPNGLDLTSYASADQIQFKVSPKIQCDGESSPLQVIDMFLSVSPLDMVSDNWEYSRDDSSSGVPSRSAFRLKKAYVGAVPNLRFRATDLSNSEVVNHTTAAEADKFKYSSDDGVTENSLGTIPNVVGTLLFYTFDVSPSVKIRPALSEV